MLERIKREVMDAWAWYRAGIQNASTRKTGIQTFPFVATARVPCIVVAIVKLLIGRCTRRNVRKRREKTKSKRKVKTI